MEALDLDDSTFTDALANAELAIVDFHAGWCGPCIMFKPKFKRIAKDYDTVSFFLVNGEKSPEARATVQIDDLPYFAVYKKGVFVEGVSLAKEEAFRAFLDKHVS
jgi:thiol-disulfide isomerase/thioredoxin